MDLSPDDDNFQGRLLHQAALWDNVELLQELLSTGADVNAKDEHGRSALHAAALAERSRCLIALMEAGADINLKSDDHTGGKTALHIAAERGHADNVSALLAAGALTHAADARGDTALALAERHSHRHAAAHLRQAQDALERERLAAHAQLRELVARGEAAALRARLQALGAAAGIVANLTPAGANTLLYVASEAGLAAGAAALVEAGADGRAHPVTQYSPLYVAAYHGHAEVAKLLLAHFPRCSQQETVEKWLPLHAACIGGHAHMVTLLLEFPYPDSVLNTYTDSSERWQYRAAFDVNARDAGGQTALYVACTLGNRNVVDALLGHTVCATPVHSSDPEGAAQTPSSPQQVTSPHRAGISLGIHALVSKLTGAGGAKKELPSETRIRPVRLDYGRGADSCVACAVRGGHASVLQRLLAAGASADASAAAPHESVEAGAKRRSRSACPAASRRSTSPPRHSERGGGAWTALALAARLRHASIARTLLDAGAVDSARALQEAAAAGLHDLIPPLLATKAYADSDHKLNKSALSESVFSDRRDPSLTYSAVCPTTPVMVNWRELRCHLAQIRMSWLRAAALRVNPKLNTSGSGAALLHALTRLDMSNNELRSLPPELFTLVSLRYMNVAQNKLERLPILTDAFEEDEGTRGRRKRKRRADVYSAPVLQELYLQDNRLEELPAELFTLPALTTLDVSNNKLRALPSAMWQAPVLRDLNAALNHLRDLPTDVEKTSDADSAAVSDTTSQRSSSPANDRLSYQKSWSRSPSIEVSETENGDEGIPSLGDRTGNAVCGQVPSAHEWRGCVTDSEPAPPGCGAPLTALNLAHNQFTCLPPVLACAAPKLQRLNMAYNSLRSMSYVTSYPRGLRQLDLSHNEITCWPSLPQVENLTSSEDNPLACYCPHGGGAAGGARGRPRSGGSVRAQLLSAACPARRHLRLEALRTVILANNMLTRIQLTTDDDGEMFEEIPPPKDDLEWSAESGLKGRLLFPLLSMLDVSCNLLRSVPPSIHELSNLAVLNISGNKDITDLPPTMGLLSRLWNLNAAGCSLQEPLHSMLHDGKYKSMDVISFLKSKLQEAKPYTRLKLMLAGVQGIGKTSLLECLRQESAIQHRRKPTDHWAKRMGNKSSRRGGNMSTVGVDIGTWVYEKQRSTRGPITFRTWDFGGQQEYYATHQYFLSKRALYLVVWKVTDGKRGLAEALNWLRSIQARAPGAPVIMVATHYDQVCNSALPESESPEALQRLIRSCIMGACDADKLGLPRVLDSVEVSCSTKHNIRLLADIIYSVAFSIKPPGSKEPLLEQRVPASYLALEECVSQLAAELPEPVLRRAAFRRLAAARMRERGLKPLAPAELRAAIAFLRDSGVLLHYDDATLKELVFLNPQWLCDVLAHVVTVREINPFASNGLMKIEDLAHVFKASPQLLRGEEASSLGVSLLNKFELALCWDSRLLLVPPLLPKAPPAHCQLPLRTRAWGASGRAGSSALAPPPPAPSADPARNTDSPTLIHESPFNVVVSGRSGGFALRRLLLLSYVPCGFWARLCTRLLSDPAIRHAAPPLYTAPPEMELDECISKALELNWGWKLWQTGLSLVCGELALLTVRELPRRRDSLLGDGDPQRTEFRLRVKQEGTWCDLDVESSACVEILLPAQVCVVKKQDNTPIGAYQSISLEPSSEVLAKVLAHVSEHVDLLLEDWYPSLGTRFVHTSEGRCLITRVVPCPACLRDLRLDAPPVPPAPPAPHPNDVAQALRRLELGNQEPRRLRLSEESRASDGDSGVGAESNASSRLGSVEGVAWGGAGRAPAPAVGWSVEECILSACAGSGAALHCPHHALRLRDVAPDTLLLDVEPEKRAKWEHVSRGAVCGRGAQGTVSAGVWRPPGQRPVQVAVKTLQPVPPPASSDTGALHAYKAALARWERDPTAAACRAYQAMRQELSILNQLRHPHVVPLLGVCPTPLALLLDLAPMGALDGVLRAYRSCGARVGVRAARALGTQAARALEYLHAHRIVYRDLKSENVLVWAMPRPEEAAAAERAASPINVNVKLADYGISRMAPPSGTKGFGGTEGFMAPEIMRYNGEEEYNEKVDCFSFGMLLYEIVTLRQPFEGHEAVKEAILEGARPTLTPKELQYPCCLLECMRRCWAGAPERRPSAAALVCVCAAPELSALQAAAAPPPPAPAPAPYTQCAYTPLARSEESEGGWEVWYAGEGDRVHTLQTTKYTFTQYYSLRVPPDESEQVNVTAICRVGHTMWVGDSVGRVTVYSSATCGVLWSARATDAVGGARCAVCALQPLAALRRVALALTNGRLFLVTSYQPEAEGSFVLTELGTATELRCLDVVPTPNGMCIWAGGAGLFAYTVGASGVCGAETLPAGPGVVALLAAPLREPCVLAYVHPGVCVYQWSVRSKQMTGKLDCSKLAPCSESLQSIAIDGQLGEDKCRITALCVSGSRAYVGTAWGCVVVAHCGTLRPLTVCRPMEEQIRAMIPLPAHSGVSSDGGESGEDRLVTLGRGYRPLLDRFTQADFASVDYSGFHCLLWRTQHWLPD